MSVHRNKEGHVFIVPNEKLMGLLQSVVEDISIAEEIEDPLDMYASLLSVAIAGILVRVGNQLTADMIKGISEQLTAHLAGKCNGSDCPKH